VNAIVMWAVWLGALAVGALLVAALVERLWQAWRCDH